MPTLHFTWVSNLGAIIDNDTAIQVTCDRCRVIHNFTRDELMALAERVGREFTFRNRRCRCRLTPGCTGWNAFYYRLGVFRPLSDPEHRAHWR